jgi:hypothetical protein
MSVSDPLTADPTSVPRRGERLTAADCARRFLRYPSPRIIGVSFAAALAARIAVGGWSWRDLVPPALLIASEPLTEWTIHVYLLHARPLRIRGRRVELPTAYEHRAHHLAPADLDGVLIPTYGLLIFVPLIAAILWGLSFPVHLVLGGDRIAQFLTGVVAGYAILGTYEWCHFLIHTPYRPRGRYYRAIWRAHRLHHYKNERYWFGITSDLGDRVLGTNPLQVDVPKSPTARTLGREPGEAATSGG